jgi:hypothetical protein
MRRPPFPFSLKPCHSALESDRRPARRRNDLMLDTTRSASQVVRGCREIRRPRDASFLFPFSPEPATKTQPSNGVGDCEDSVSVAQSFVESLKEHKRRPIAMCFPTREVVFYRLAGTLAPLLRASDNPIAMACFLLLTRPPFPPFPERSVPRFFRRIAFRTLLPAAFPYLAMNPPKISDSSKSRFLTRMTSDTFRL